MFEGVIARVHGPGDGLEYPNRVEYRDLAEVRRIVKAAPGTPVIVNHPPKDPKTGGRLDPEKTQVVGKILSARLDGEEAVVKFEITHPSGLTAIGNGLDELSLGYDVGRLDSKGYQRDVVLDHLAIVRHARCGAACKIGTRNGPARTDDKPCACSPAEHMPHSACTCAPADLVPNTDSGNHTMAIKTPTPADPSEALRSLETQRADAATRATTAESDAATEKLRADTAEGKIIELENEITELRTTIAAGASSVETEAVTREKTRADSAEELVRQFDAKHETRVRARVALERKAWTVMGPDFRMDDMDDRQIQASVVKHLDASADVSAMVPEGVICGRFLALTERHDSSARSLARVSEIQASTTRVDAREEARATKRDSWKQPLPNAARHSR